LKKNKTYFCKKKIKKIIKKYLKKLKKKKKKKKMHQDGTATWLLEGSVFGQWSENGSSLWVYGKRQLPILTSQRY